jgi:ribonuclease-3 family protein
MVISEILSNTDVQRLSPNALAYIGDAVYELYVRQALLFPPKRPRLYHKIVVAQVRAEQQALYLEQLYSTLTDDEKDVVRRGRNAASSRPSRHNLDTYQRASGLETLIGYLHLTDPPRLQELLEHLKPALLEPIT